MTSSDVKCVVVGDGGVGKTCLLIGYTTNTFEEDHIPTIVVDKVPSAVWMIPFLDWNACFDNYKATIKYNDKPVSLGLWDTAGQTDYDRIRPLSYPQTDVLVLCFATNHRDSFDNIREKWVPEVRHHCPNVPIVLVATKKDMRTNENNNIKSKHVSYNEGLSMCRQIKAAKYVECSAKTFEGINDVFQEAVKAAVSNPPCYIKKRVGKKCSLL